MSSGATTLRRECAIASALHEAAMARAVTLARRGVGDTSPNPPVGAVVLAADGTKAGEGYHKRAGGAHAEVLAIRQAGERARGGSLYVTLEPCSTYGRTPPCTDAILSSGVSEVFVAVRDPNPRHAGRGLSMLRKAGIHVGEGLCADEAQQLIRPFAKWVTRGIPYVTLKLGMTLDGRIADATGASKWITGGESRRAVQSLRGEADAVLVGAGTVRADDPSLLDRRRSRPRGKRIVVDASGRLSLKHRIFSDGFAERTIVAVTRACPDRRRSSIEATGAVTWVLRGTSSGRVGVASLLRSAGRDGMLHILCEGGGELADALVRAGAVDRFVFFLAPALMGGSGLPAIGGKGWRIRRMPRLAIVDVRRSGEDIRIEAVPLKTRGRDAARVS